MTLASLLVRQVDIVSSGFRFDDYGDTTPDWSTSTTYRTTGWLAQTTSVEDVNGRNATASTLTLTVPAGTPVTARDRVIVDGRTYEVIAEPLAAWTPRGEHHRELILEAVVG